MMVVQVSSYNKAKLKIFSIESIILSTENLIIKKTANDLKMAVINITITLLDVFRRT